MTSPSAHQWLALVSALEHKVAALEKRCHLQKQALLQMTEHAATQENLLVELRQALQRSKHNSGLLQSENENLLSHYEELMQRLEKSLHTLDEAEQALHDLKGASS